MIETHQSFRDNVLVRMLASNGPDAWMNINFSSVMTPFFTLEFGLILIAHLLVRESMSYTSTLDATELNYAPETKGIMDDFQTPAYRHVSVSVLFCDDN